MLWIAYFIYSVVWTLLLPVLYALAHSFIPKWRPGLHERLGFLDPEKFPQRQLGVNKQGPIWFHAVSVGELNTLLPLLKFFVGLEQVVSVTTATAYKLAAIKLAKEIEDNQIKLFYMPYDHPLIVAKVFKQVQPSALVLMESEIWPALFHEAHKAKIPLALINAKLSDSSFALYKTFYSVFSHVFGFIDMALVQSPADSRKYLEMGLDKKNIFMMGNMKFSSIAKVSKEEIKKLKQDLGYQDDDIIIVCASTHEEEEALLVSIYQELQQVHNNLRLVIAPRHPERFVVVEDIINSAARLIPKRFSGFACEPIIQDTNDVLLLDTIGDLLRIYAIADIAFVGGTINPKVGGHNVLEPAASSLATVIGPHYHKNTAMVAIVEEAGALEIAESKEEIRLVLSSLIENNDKRILMKANAKTLIEKNKKIVFNVAEKLKTCMQLN